MNDSVYISSEMKAELLAETLVLINQNQEMSHQETVNNIARFETPQLFISNEPV